MGDYDKIKETNVITISQGSTYNDTVTVSQSNGNPVDLTGYTVSSQLRTEDGVQVATFICTVATPASGVIARELTAEATAALTPTKKLIPKHVWGVELTTPSGDVLPEIQGGALVDIEVVIPVLA